MKLVQYQTGATLFVALMFLLIMTLFAVSSINMSTVNLKIVGNMQSIKQMEALAQDAIEQVLSDSGRFGASPTTTGDIDVTFKTATGDVIELTAEIDVPVCLNWETASGYSAVQENIIPQDTTWEVIVRVKDNFTGASVVVHQGIEIRMLSGNCPDPS